MFARQEKNDQIDFIDYGQQGLHTRVVKYTHTAVSRKSRPAETPRSHIDLEVIVDFSRNRRNNQAKLFICRRDPIRSWPVFSWRYSHADTPIAQYTLLAGCR